MKYTTIVETASMQMPDLISNFGGKIGLHTNKQNKHQQKII